MHYQRQTAVWILTMICFMLTIAAAALGDVSTSGQPAVESAASDGEAETMDVISQANSEPSEPVLLSPLGPAKNQKAPTTPVHPANKVESPSKPEASAPTPKPAVVDLSKHPVPAKPKPQVQVPKAPAAPKPAAKPVPDPKTLAKTDVKVLKQEHPSLISRIIDSTKGLVGRAMQWLGTRYIWGGISTKGVDCSGLTKLLYSKEGITLPRTAKQQFQQGRPVMKSALLPGDLVFFNTMGPITHVGMYIGNNKFVHAANPKRGVRIDSLSSAYYNKRYAGARRYKTFG